MTTVSNSKGGQTSVTYTPSTNAKASNAELPYDLLVVTAMGIYDGLGNAATTTYSYSGGKQYLVAWRARPQIRGLCQHHHERSRLARRTPILTKA